MRHFPDALELERTTLSSLRLAGEQPTRGREYFSIRLLGTVLDIADNYTALVPKQIEQVALF